MTRGSVKRNKAAIYGRGWRRLALFPSENRPCTRAVELERALGKRLISSFPGLKKYYAGAGDLWCK